MNTLTTVLHFLNLFIVLTNAAYLPETIVEPVSNGFPIPPKTVDKLVISAYLGRWYQMYSSAIPISTFERGGVCITADYTSLPVQSSKILKDVVSFSVVNSQRLFTPNGKLVQVDGVATNKHPGVPIETGKFFLALNTTTGNTVNGLYWVIELSPIDVVDKKYSWAVVSVPFKTQLFILARNVTHFKTYDEAFVLDLVKERGFTNDLNKPIATKQTSNCQYAPLN